jgi:hypothetical protein
MKQTLSKYDFVDQITKIRPDNFTPYALEEMFDWFELYEGDCGEEVEFDPIAICCDFGQYSLEEINNDYSQEFKDMEQAIEWLNDQTLVIANTDQWVVFQGF